MRRAIVHFLWEGLAIVVAFCLMFFIAVWNGWIGYMPDMDTLSNPIDKFATQVYSANGKLIGTWNEDNGNRVAVDYNSISPNLVHALVATEDERFYEHSGIDYIALGRAIIKRGILGHHEAGGGSTITQQLAKQLYSEKAHGTLERMLQKPIEWIIAIKLERYFTKEEIIAMYLNYFDFLHNAVGIKRAANIYFDKEPWQLNLDESSSWWVCARTPRCSIPSAIRIVAASAAMWCWLRCSSVATSPQSSTARRAPSPWNSISPAKSLSPVRAATSRPSSSSI